MMRYEIVLFDADDTLFDFPRAERHALGHGLGRFGFPYSEEVYALYHRLNHALWEMLERGETDFAGIQRRRFQDLFREMGWSGDTEQVNKAFVDGLEEGIFLLEGAEELCRGLDGKAELYLATNGISRAQRARLAGSALAPYFKGIFISEELGAKKPDPAFFEAALARLGDLERGRILMVGDRLTADIAGAAAAGLDSCWYNPTGQGNPTGIRPTYEARDYARIKEIILQKEAAC